MGPLKEAAMAKVLPDLLCHHSISSAKSVCSMEAHPPLPRERGSVDLVQDRPVTVCLCGCSQDREPIAEVRYPLPSSPTFQLGQTFFEPGYSSCIFGLHLGAQRRFHRHDGFGFQKLG